MVFLHALRFHCIRPRAFLVYSPCVTSCLPSPPPSPCAFLMGPSCTPLHFLLWIWFFAPLSIAGGKKKRRQDVVDLIVFAVSLDLRVGTHEHFSKCAALCQVCLTLPSVPHFAKCGALCQVCLTFPSVLHFANCAALCQVCHTLPSVPHFAKCAALCQVCRPLPSVPHFAK